MKKTIEQFASEYVDKALGSEESYLEAVKNNPERLNLYKQNRAVYKELVHRVYKDVMNMNRGREVRSFPSAS